MSTSANGMGGNFGASLFSTQIKQPRPSLGSLQRCMSQPQLSEQSSQLAEPDFKTKLLSNLIMERKSLSKGPVSSDLPNGVTLANKFKK